MTFNFSREFYGNTARFDNQQRALTEDELHRFVPSVFAETAHSSRSERFRPIPTINVIRAMAKEGFQVVGAKQSRSKHADGALYTKHLLRIRMIDQARTLSVGDTVFEALLKNANDGSSAYELMAGLFKIQCLNSMVAMEMQMETLKVRHSGDVASKVIEGTYRIIDEAPRALEAPVAWSQVHLNADERLAFANAAHGLRFADADGTVTTNVKPVALLQERRASDSAPDLWHTFNRVQENCIKGGLDNFGTNANGALVRRTTRPIKGIDQDVKLNRALFTLAAEMAKLKKAA